MTDHIRTFLGLPVEGDINEGATRKDQRPLEDLQPILQALIDDETIIEFGWRQYTPYFNDGDPCIFDARSAWVRTTADDEDTRSSWLDVYGHPSLGKRPHVWDATNNSYHDGPYEGHDEARYDRCHAFRRAVNGGEFLDVLAEAFGDHADVTIRRDGIQVEFYDHD
jgi:hypothetical protein